MKKTFCLPFLLLSVFSLHAYPQATSIKSSSPLFFEQPPIVPAWGTRAYELPFLPYQPRDYGRCQAAPDEAIVVCGTKAGYVMALSPATGAVRWQYKTSNAIRSRPAITQDSVFVGSTDGCLTRLDIKTGTPLWNAPFCTNAPIYGDLTVSQTHLFFTVNTNKVYALSMEDGRFLWEYHRDQPSSMTMEGVASPLLEDNHLYVGFSDGTLVSLDATDGKLQWANNLAAGFSRKNLDVDSNFLIDNGVLYASTFSAGPIAIDKTTGATLWRENWRGCTTPVIHKGRIIFGTADGDIVALRLSDRKLLSSTHLLHFVPSTPLLVGDMLLVATDQGIWALQQDNLAPLSRLAVPFGVQEITAALGNRIFFVGGGGVVHAADVWPL